ncbi:MAG: PrsW family glutamic-type intramembrane protease [Candidatus Gracilibacteria bacterium]|jgi:RsiW-degrading membrane proteinase PrsW (M82 family)
MFENPIILLGLSGFFVAVPAIIWLCIFLSKSHNSKKTVAGIFFLGSLTAPALLLLQVFWQKFPTFNLAALIENNISNQNTQFVFMFVLFGAMEEIIKHYVVSVVDKKTLLIKTIGNAILYSITAALGFAFAENIYYLYSFWNQITIGELAGMYIFRSIITACAHMVFSGIFGFYFGIGKFAIYITDQEQWTDGKHFITKTLAKIFNWPRSLAYKKTTIYKGLFIAIILHTTYNFLLQFNITIPVVLFVICGYLYLRYLLSKKTEHLLLATDISSAQKSKMNKKDEEVILEFIGVLFKEKKYIDVINTCDRLLKKDPDNNVIKLLKAKANDILNDKEYIKSIFKDEDPNKKIDNKVLGQNVTTSNNIQLVKSSQPKEKLNEELSKKDMKHFLDEYIGEGTFKL